MGCRREIIISLFKSSLLLIAERMPDFVVIIQAIRVYLPQNSSFYQTGLRDSSARLLRERCMWHFAQSELPS